MICGWTSTDTETVQAEQEVARREDIDGIQCRTRYQGLPSNVVAGRARLAMTWLKWAWLGFCVLHPSAGIKTGLEGGSEGTDEHYFSAEDPDSISSLIGAGQYCTCAVVSPLTYYYCYYYDADGGVCTCRE